MRKPYILPFLRNAAILIAASLSFACHRTADNETADILKNVESYISDRPDSALTVIQSIGADDLSSRELKARHALLLSQALDKNFIDLQSDSIIASAVKFFEKSGDHEALFKAYYYNARVLSNAGRYTEAMQIYLKAEEMSAKINDLFAVGLLHSQIGGLNSKYFNYSKAIEYYQKAGKYHEIDGVGTIDEVRDRIFAVMHTL